ncbi:hypothetical protein F5Y08DRAFT_319985 [Xylaria arbuscula]|nr:hypothetical protein F5Y08DRAFT_319985 [Xylaria arbuscula]
MANATSCPENANSTDCLLRLLYQRIDDQFSDYEWDPITFGFTAATGIIAALFALFAIYQAIVAAGQGSRKCNRRAIGMWSSKTTKRWDWNELYRISTAQTPILTNIHFLDLSSPTEENPGEEDGYSRALRSWESSNEGDDPSIMTNPEPTIMKVFRVLLKLTHKQPPEMFEVYAKELRIAQLHKPQPWEWSSRDPSVASWVAFLEELGLDYSKLEHFPLKKQIADYLPADFLAVPAYGQVSFIVAAAAAIGAYSWDIDVRTGFPTILGRDFQFEFRQHPSFGMIGAFDQYSSGLRAPQPPTIEQVNIAIQQAVGDLRTSSYLRNIWEFNMRKHKRKGDQNAKLFNGIRDYSQLFWETAQKFYVDSRVHELGVCVCRFYAQPRRMPETHNLTWLFLVHTPARPPVIFPSRLIQNTEIFTVLALHSRFWASLEKKHQLTSINRRSPLPKLVPGHEQWRDGWNGDGLLTRVVKRDVDDILATLDSEVGLLNRLILDHLSESTVNSTRILGNSATTGYLRISGAVMEGTVKFLYGAEDFKAWVRGLQHRNQQYFRILILLQLVEIERWLIMNSILDKHIEQLITCEMISLWTTSLVLLDAKVATTEGTFGFLAPKAKQTLAWDQDFPLGCPDSDVTARHFGTLQIMKQLLNEMREIGLDEIEGLRKLTAEHLPYGAMTVEEKVRVNLIKEKISEYISPSSNLMYLYPTADTDQPGITYNPGVISVFQRLTNVLNTCGQNIESNKGSIQINKTHKIFNSQTNSQTHRDSKAFTSGPGVMQKEEAEAAQLSNESPENVGLRTESIRDVLIWKYLLMGMLFLTAPDSSELIMSGVWDRVVPIM